METKCIVKIGKRKVKRFKTERGIKQDCAICTLLTTLWQMWGREIRRGKLGISENRWSKMYIFFNIYGWYCNDYRTKNGYEKNDVYNSHQNRNTTCMITLRANEENDVCCLSFCIENIYFSYYFLLFSYYSVSIF